MPRFDQTGPKGEGSMTGRKKGKCAIPDGKDSPNEAVSAAGSEEKVPGRGPGRGAGAGTRGPGRGKGRRGTGQGAGLGLKKRLRGGQQ